MMRGWQRHFMALGLLILATSLAQGAEYLTREEALKLAFPGECKIEKRTVTASKEELKRIAALARSRSLPAKFEFYAGETGGKPAGFAVISNVRGKALPITFMVAMDPAGSVTTVEILAFRESHGGEVRQRRFLDQFKGKRAGDKLALNSDIRKVSGATVSCRSVTDGTRAILAYIAELVVSGRARKAQVQPVDLLTASAPEGPACVSRAQYLMGTLLEITLYAPDRAAAHEAMSAAFAEVARLEGLLSTYRPDSAISRLNRAAGTEAVPLDAEVLALLERSRTMALRTDGAFDVTVGPLVAVWKRAADRNAAPTPADIRAARSLVGAPALHVALDRGEAMLPKGGMSVDLGAIGKGYALDRAAQVLYDRGISSALLDFGGQLLAVGPPPHSAGWPVAVRDPRGGEASAPLALLHLARGSIATSADDQRGMRVAGRQVSHIIDPRTGRPAEGMLSATVVTETAVEADALSTALFVLGLDQGRNLAQQQGLTVLLLDDDGRLARIGGATIPAGRAWSPDALENPFTHVAALQAAYRERSPR